MTVIEPKWLTEVAPQFFRVADAARISKRKRDEKIVPLFDRFAQDQDEWRISVSWFSRLAEEQMLTPAMTEIPKDSPDKSDVLVKGCRWAIRLYLSLYKFAF